MFNRVFTDVLAVATAIVGLAIIAVLVSKKADTANVLKAAGDALSKNIGAAVKPVTN